MSCHLSKPLHEAVEAERLDVPPVHDITLEHVLKQVRFSSHGSTHVLSDYAKELPVDLLGVPVCDKFSPGHRSLLRYIRYQKPRDIPVKNGLYVFLCVLKPLLVRKREIAVFQARHDVIGEDQEMLMMRQG